MENLISKNLESFNKYYELLVEENNKYNLTNITQKDEVFEKHFNDSIYMNKIIDLNSVESLCDIGSGAGFPALPLKIAYPHLKITIIEPTLKRVNFMKMVCDKLDLKDVTIINGRAEDVIKDYRETFDVVTARAVANLQMLLELTVPYAKVNGYVISYKGSNAKEELALCNNAFNILKCSIHEIKEYELNDSYGKRTLIKIVKNEKTNNKYPRRFAEIKKKLL